MRTEMSLGSMLLAGVVLVAIAAPLDASAGPPRGTARATRPSSSPSGSSSSGSSGVVSRSGGSRSSGSQAVSRGASSGSSRHGAAVTRPPAGSSGGVVRYGERHGGGGGNGIWYPGWWDNYWHFGFGFGHPWGYYWGPYSWSHYGWWGGYRYGPSPGYGYGYGTDYRQLRYQEPGAVDLNVKPKHTEVYVDGDLVGTAGKFDGFPDYLWLTPGAHEIVLYRDGFVTQRRVVEIRPAWVVDVRVALADGETISPDRISRPIESDESGERDQAWRERD